MYISRIELTNIKSHSNSVYDFGPGTTAIRGDNGTGKTTMIEAIAWVMFDLLDYSKEQFVRRGEKKGSVAVTFISALDEREYIVRRDSGSGYNVTDPRINTRIADKKDEVIRFLWQHLGLEPGTDLESLFRHAIGVPQGTFTAVFLSAANSRKVVFDRLLKVEEYRDAAAKLLDTVRHIDAKIVDAREEIARAEGILLRAPNVDEEQRLQSIETGKMTQELAAKDKELTSRRHLVSILDQIEKVSAAAENAEAERVRVQKQLVQLENAHTEIAGLRPMGAEQQELDALAKTLGQEIAAKRAVRDQLKRLDESIERLRERYRLILGQIKDAEERSKGSDAIASLEQRDAELTTRVARLRAELERDQRFQSEIENGLCPILSQKCLNLKPGETLESFVASQFPTLRAEIATVEIEQQKTTADLRHAREARQIASTLETLNKTRVDLSDEGQRLRAERDRIATDTADLETIEHRLSALSDKLRELGDPRSRIIALEAEISREAETRRSMTEIESTLERLTADHGRLVEELETADQPEPRVAKYDAAQHQRQKIALRDLETRRAGLAATLAAAEQRVAQLATEIERFAATRIVLGERSREKERLEEVRETTSFIRDTLKEAAPRIARNYVHHISVEANQLFREITGNGERTLEWNDDYSITMEADGFARPFLSLSGGEQMSAALAVRLALLKQLTDIRLAFFDEPTTNMDETRRDNLAMEISRIKHFDQLFVISHDDTFDNYVDDVIALG